MKKKKMDMYVSAASGSVCSMTGMAVYGMEPDIPYPAVVSGQAQAVSIQAPSAVLMEASTGKLLFEKDADEKRSPASVTKVMTLLLIFEL